jgi:hypothetical protein
LRRPFFLGFLAAALLHLYLVQYTAGRGHTSYDIDMPTFYLIEVLWNGIPTEHWQTISRASTSPPLPNGIPPGRLFVSNMGAAEFAHANFRGIGTQLFSILYGALTGFLAQSLARQGEQKRAASAP